MELANAQPDIRDDFFSRINPASEAFYKLRIVLMYSGCIGLVVYLLFT